MGAWGSGIRQDDFVMDVIGDFEEQLKAGNSVAAASKELKTKYTEEMKDEDDGPLFWIALADAQWTYGELDPEVLRRVEEDFESDQGLARWDEGRDGRSKRRAVLAKFIAKISTPNGRPKKPAKIVVRAPKFQAGDCLSVHLSNGQYGAALVLAADHSHAEYGKNLICVLDYLGSEKPTLDAFHVRKWLKLTHHSYQGRADCAWYGTVGFRAMKDRIEVVGQLQLLKSDPYGSDTYSGWARLGEQVLLQREWDARGA
ncbi:MAG: hypothetical protein IPK87_11155 [Planctomycetes bacterium]|nr:hypothetical protein [Planctomycetota bacterium]